MFPMHTQDNLRDHEREVRRGAEKRRRLEDRRERDRPLDLDALTTGDVAALTGISSRKVSQWIDTGLLPGWMVPEDL